MNKFIFTIMIFSLIALIPSVSFGKESSGINLTVDEEKPVVEVERQEDVLKRVNSEQPKVRRTIITPKEEKNDEADNYLQNKDREFININAPLNKMMNLRR